MTENRAQHMALEAGELTYKQVQGVSQIIQNVTIIICYITQVTFNVHHLFTTVQNT